MRCQVRQAKIQLGESLPSPNGGRAGVGGDMKGMEEWKDGKVERWKIGKMKQVYDDGHDSMCIAHNPGGVKIKYAG